MLRPHARVAEGRIEFTVAIDGPAAAGKGTIGRAVAAALGFAHLDTGLLYRAVGVQALSDGRGVIDPHWAAELARRLSPEDLARADLRSARAGQAASQGRGAAGGARGAPRLPAQLRPARRRRGARRARHRHRDLPGGRGQALRHRLRRGRARSGGGPSSGARERSRPVLADLRARDARDAARDVAPMMRGEGCALARHHGFVYRRGRRRGRRLREEPTAGGA